MNKNYAYYNNLQSVRCDNDYILCSILKLCGNLKNFNNNLVLQKDNVKTNSVNNNIYTVSINSKLLKHVSMTYIRKDIQPYNIHVSLYLFAIYNFNIFMILQTLTNYNCIIISVDNMNIFFVSSENMHAYMEKYINDKFYMTWCIIEHASTWCFYSEKIYIYGSSHKFVGIRAPIVEKKAFCV